MSNFEGHISYVCRNFEGHSFVCRSLLRQNLGPIWDIFTFNFYHVMGCTCLLIFIESWLICTTIFSEIVCFYHAWGEKKLLQIILFVDFGCSKYFLHFNNRIDLPDKGLNRFLHKILFINMLLHKISVSKIGSICIDTNLITWICRNLHFISFIFIFYFTNFLSVLISFFYNVILYLSLNR